MKAIADAFGVSFEQAFVIIDGDEKKYLTIKGGGLIS